MQTRARERGSVKPPPENRHLGPHDGTDARGQHNVASLLSSRDAPERWLRKVRDGLAPGPDLGNHETRGSALQTPEPIPLGPVPHGKPGHGVAQSRRKQRPGPDAFAHGQTLRARATFPLTLYG